MTNFQNEYQKLNLEQKLAVNTIEGPVMVIAGAGTGKTQTIALRIANILDKTDTKPSSVLCLTYTDVAANNMRNRLLDMIGPDAYKVKICTFHAFCNDIISSNPQYFPFASSSLKAIDDLETIEIIKNIIDHLDNSSPLITWGDRYCYQRSILDCLHLAKRENISKETLLDLIKDEENFFQNSGDFINQLSNIRATKNNYSEINKIFDELENSKFISLNLKSHLQIIRSGNENLSQVKNEVRKFYQDFEKNIPKQKEFVKIFDQYQQELQKRALYDYEDMILFVIKAFNDNPDLLLNFQEKYQYILVDEYQDTNSSQSQIIDLLGSYYDNPNIFVVGDDDQSIFRFQGASIENIYNFYQKYNPKKIVLKNNYRSHKLILDSSDSVISHNKNRIANLITDIDKTLIANKNYDPDPINLITLNSNIEEDYYVAQKISDLIKSGQSPSEIAILLRKNRDAEELTKMLSAFNIKFFLPSDSNLLKNPLIIQIIKLLEFVDNPNLNESVYHILAAPFIKLNSLDLVKILKSKTILCNLIFDEKEIDKLNVSDKSKQIISKFGKRIAKTKVDLENYPLEKVLNKILKRFRILKYCLSKNDIESLNQVHSFYKLLKDTVAKKDLSLKEFIDRIHLYDENKISVSSPSITYDSSDSIKILTVHGAKGLEFDHVFIYRLLEDSWEKQRDFNKLKLPFGILRSEITKSIEDDYEEDRRLFYVALTRAKKQIYLSYSQYKENGKNQNPSIFVSEIDSKLIENIKFNDKTAALKTYYQFTDVSHDLKPDLSEYLKDYLTNHYKFNVSHLNSYLRCPLCFYYKTILRIPQNKEKFSSFGTAIHTALSVFYQKKSQEEILKTFEQSLKNERLPKADYQWCLENGHKILTQYYDQYVNSVKDDNISEYNFAAENIVYKNIPLTGKIDLIEKEANGKINVIDFKTGNSDNKYKELSSDGDYYRQIVFYKLLLDIKNDSRFKFNQGIIDFIEKSKLKKSFIRKEISVADEDLNKLKTQIEDVYQKILNLEFFEIGKDCKDKDHLHYLLK
ncbi:MAG: ATP-dependent DNA helicase [Candidatus Shapirobacteria bacterium]|nr:ATP-dependent DNA helicase [Candidatus Shapirobacteria bacterium]MDD4410770.1 ATP-dependent DNA helicase [Candidatus Shapirobacteria bacterium]